MTPLAHKITKGIVEGKHQGFKKYVRDIHCFELTGCNGLIDQIAEDLYRNKANLSGLFMPFPKTWIEMKLDNIRVAYLLCDIHPGANVRRIIELPNGTIKIHSQTGWLDFSSGGGFFETTSGLEYPLCAMLTLINTPQNVGCKRHRAHKGLIREAKAIDGFFPVNAWTEINIQLGTRIHTGNGSYEIRQGPGKCLHWVRSFKRNRMGKDEIVKAHMRGDASLGYKQSRYMVNK